MRTYMLVEKKEHLFDGWMTVLLRVGVCVGRNV